MEAEFQDIDENGSWAEIYQDIRQQSCDLPCKVAKLPENKTRNRYRDVSPFDHSRIHLQLGANDYINASLITVEEAQRKYILTQIKCAQYWPHREEKDAVFDTNFKVTFVSEDVKSYYTVRQLELENLGTGETREILHFHYTTWPDFGVPESPASFLNFLYKVRESGCLNSDQGPVVVHCSAGIGRSGTFCLVDTCLLLMSMRRDPSSVRIQDVLLEMRRHRMGLIQTADQLRFSYLAVIEGAKYIDGDKTLQDSWKEISHEEDEPPEFTPPLPPPRDTKTEMQFFHQKDEVTQQMIHCLGSSQEPQLRQRIIPDRTDVDDHVGIQDSTSENSAPSQQHQQQQQEEEEEEEEEEEQDETEKARCPEQERPKCEDFAEPGTWSPFLTNVCLYTAVALSAYACYRAYFH
uniref:Tyrosine-protein phosphatase non-receptor type n=1 Tax=Knipowitschia caucasica TaxID=637954 RepID=A0AAV2LZI5_KNICA